MRVLFSVENGRHPSIDIMHAALMNLLSMFEIDVDVIYDYLLPSAQLQSIAV